MNVSFFNRRWKGEVKMGNYTTKLEADGNELDKRGYTKLMEAVHKGDIKSVNALLEAGANVNKGNKKGFTPLIIAARYGVDKCVKTVSRRRSWCERLQQERHARFNSVSVHGPFKVREWTFASRSRCERKGTQVHSSNVCSSRRP